MAKGKIIKNDKAIMEWANEIRSEAIRAYERTNEEKISEEFWWRINNQYPMSCYGPAYDKEKVKELISDGVNLSKANLFSFDGRKVFNRCMHEDDTVKSQIYLPMFMVNAIYNYDNVLSFRAGILGYLCPR